MNKKAITGSTLGFVIFLAVTTAGAAPSAYFQAITNLSPAGYWPMHEIAAPAPGDIETNYGTLGLLGTGYYPDWALGGPPTSIKRGVAGALTNDSDQAVSFTRGASPAAGTYTNNLYVPHTSPLATLNPPFSVECWYFPTSTVSEDIWAQCGDEGLNQGGTSGGNAGSLAGVRLVWGNGTNTGFEIFNLNGAQNSAGFSGNIGGVPASPITNWYHVVVVCDASTNFSLYVNGNPASLANGQSGSPNNGVGSYTPDYWSPMTIGGGRGGTRACGGYIDEFAVYTNVLGDISTHYNDGVGGAAGSYFHDVTNDSPVIYLRMDAPASYTPPAIGVWPVLTNYGNVAVNGVYSPGTIPGIVTTPVANPNGVAFGGVSGNLAALSGISSFADAGYAPAYNPTGAVPFSVTALFRGDPCDGRTQTIVGHSDNSWNIIMTTAGKLLWRFGTNTTANPTSLRVYNDGNWHQVVAVYAPNSTPTLPGTNFLYVDGVLDFMTNNASTNGFLPGTNADVLIGSDPQYTNNPAGAGRQFAGQVCEVAIFTNALAATDVQTLYNAAHVAPYIITQPVTGRNVNGGPGTATSFAVVANGAATLAYQWYFNSSSNYTGATKLTDGLKYTNSATAQVTVTNLGGGDAGYYFVVATNSYGSATSILASLTVNTSPNITNYFPVAYTNVMTLYAGASPAFTVLAKGALPLTYFWFTNGVVVGGATNANVTLANVQASFSNYCIVSNFLGTATSIVWNASVIADPAAPYPVSVLAAHPVGYWRLNEGPDDGLGNQNVIAHDYAGGNDGLYTNVNIGQTPGYNASDPETSTLFGETGISFFDSFAGQIAGIDFSAPTNAGSAFSVEAWVESIQNNVSAGLVTKGYGTLEQFCIDSGGTGHALRFFVRDASGGSHVASSTFTPVNFSWHHVVGVCDQVNGAVSLYVDGALAASTSIPTNGGILSATNLMQIGSKTSTPTTNVNDLQFYGNMNDVAVYNYALGSNQIAAQFSSAGSIPPFFTQRPAASLTVSELGTLVIPATAFGTAPLTNVWFDVNGGTNLTTGSTNALSINGTLTVSNVPPTWNNDTLQLTVANAYGLTNVTVTLIVFTNPPQITRDLPAQATVVFSNSYPYSIAVTGLSPFYYQWYNAGTPIAGQTNSTYTATPGSPGSSTYFVVITNVIGATTSSVSTLRSLPLQITQDLPAQYSVPAGSSFTYSIGVAGTGPFGYQWYHVTTPVGNQTNSTYTVTAGSVGSSTTYFVVITNIYGALTSTVSTLSSLSQLTNPFAAELQQFHPVGYWPMHEMEPAAPGDIETNYGTLGLLGTGYYPDWVLANANAGGIVRNAPGALAGDSDTAIGLTFGTANAGTTVQFTNGLYVPHTSPLSTLNPPFTVECWFYPTNSPTGEAVWAQTGAVGLNDGAGGSLVNYNGIMLNWANGTLVPYGFNGQSGSLTGNNGAKLEGSQGDAGGTPVEPTNQWCHVVVACDANTNFSLYANGTLVAGPKADVGLYSPDFWTPISIGCGNGGLRSSAGSIDEFSVYPTNLAASNILAHYVAGTNASASPTYFQVVTNDNPAIYLRLDAPPYTAPNVGAWPELINYGSVGTPGAYAPGTMPGIVTGPLTTNGAPYLGVNSTNVAQFSGVSSFADAGYDPAFNPTGAVPFSVTAMFRGNPCDGRVQAIVGHSDNSWRILMNTNGTLQCQLGTDAGSLVDSTGVYNDGNWHQVVEVYSPATSTHSIYVDGVLDASVNTASGITPGSSLDVMIAGDPQYTNNPAGVGRQFAGQVCEVALFDTSLTDVQVQQIYNAALTGTVVLAPTISATRSGNNVTLTYVGTLLSSTNVVGPYNAVGGASSPYTTPATNAQQFYRTSSP